MFSQGSSEIDEESKRSRTKGCQQSLETGKRGVTDSPLELSEGTQA